MAEKPDIPKLTQEVFMTRRTEFKGSSTARRRARRAELQSQESVSSEVMHRPTPSRVVLQCKRKSCMKSEVVTITSMVSKYEGSVCLPDVAMYNAGYRKTVSVSAR